MASFLTSVWFVGTLLGLGMVMSVVTGKLTGGGAITGGVLGMAIFLGAGYTGLTMLGLFFILGTGATAWKISFKQQLGLAELNKGRRTAGQALANAGIPGMLGACAWLVPEYATLFRMMLAAGFAAATADTLSSELGNVYGRRFYNILTLQKDTRGLNGVISMEGTSFGVAGSALISGVYGLGFGWNSPVLAVFIAGVAGNLFDSYLGATLERRGSVSNNTVNFLNTLAAALVAWFFY